MDTKKLNVRYLWVVVFILLSVPAEARLELSVFRPVAEFVTNNKELVIEGTVKCPEVQRVAVSINTPSGLSDLDSLEGSLQSLVVDLGSSHSLTALVLWPVFEGQFSMGPRVINLSFSQNGKTFEDAGNFNCTSGMGGEYGEARAELMGVINARYAQIDMLEGWQAGRIGLQDVGFLNATGELLKVRIRDVAISFDLGEDGMEFFQMTTLLREGDNNISVVAKALGPVEEVGEIEEEVALVMVTYIPEVAVEEDRLILSDGYKAELNIPAGALMSRIKKIRILPLNVGQIQWTSYSDNMRIARNTDPVVAYEVEASIETSFPATAKDSLERQPPDLAVDGNPEYPSTWMSTISSLPVWLKIDLREPRSIGEVIVTARVENGISYGPKRLSILVSDDEVSYDEAAICDECNDKETEITLAATPTARYVQIVIEEGKQGNNIQINEVEFRDDEGTRIVSYAPLSSVALLRPAELTLLYDDLDLTAAGVQMEENLAIFSWNEGMQEWQIMGGKVDPFNNWVSIDLNHFSTFALFEAVPYSAEVRWSYNPFSPNGDGIADTTTMSINLNAESEGQAKVEIFDHNGKLIRTLVHEEAQSGHISIMWDGKDENGDRVDIGLYIYQVIAGKEVRNGILAVAR